MAFDDSENSGAISAINVTPLVDVMLVLLIIFMVAAPILQQGVELDLPQETIAPIEGNDEQLVISINQDGKIFIGSKNEVAISDLTQRVKGIIERREDKRVFIRADKRVSYGEVMSVMATIKRGGISKVGLITEPSQG